MGAPIAPDTDAANSGGGANGGERSAAEIFVRHETEIAQDDTEDLGPGHVGVEDHRGKRARPERFQDGAAERGLARAGLAGEQQHALAPPQPVQQLAERALVRLAQVEELRIGGDRKRLIVEAVEGFIDRISQGLWRGRWLHASIIGSLPR